MSWTKRDFILQAFNELGMSDYLFDISPEELNFAGVQLDAMIANWNQKGIRIGYPIASSPSSLDIDVDTNAPDVANEAIYKNLAMRIAPSYGKAVSNETKISASDAFSTLSSKYSYPVPMQFPSTLPAGAGNKPWITTLNPFIQPPVDSLVLGKDHILKL